MVLVFNSSGSPVRVSCCSSFFSCCCSLNDSFPSRKYSSQFSSSNILWSSDLAVRLKYPGLPLYVKRSTCWSRFAVYVARPLNPSHHSILCAFHKKGFAHEWRLGGGGGGGSTVNHISFYCTTFNSLLPSLKKTWLVRITLLKKQW